MIKTKSPLFYYGLRMNMFMGSAIKVKDSNIPKAAVYPPVASKTRFAAVAIKDPTITVKVMSAMLVEKYFMPKKEDVYAAVIVGQEP